MASPRSASPHIVFVVPNLIGAYTAAPLIQAAIDEKLSVEVSCPEALVSQLRSRLPQTAAITEIPSRPRRRRLVSGLQLALTPHDFSAHYKLVVDEGMRVSARRRAAARVARAMAVRPPRLNGLLRRLTALRSVFGDATVVAVTRVQHPELLAGRGGRLAVLLESWDHGSKHPAGVLADDVIAWNEDLAQDWIGSQGGGRSLVGYPWKLRAMDVALPAPSKWSVMYPAGTSSATPYAGWFEQELRVIDGLCQATASVGVPLLIKPKPNGRPGDFDEVAGRYAHVDVGQYSESDGSAAYWLDDAYNAVRLGELGRSSIVVNCWTTFALDAALARRPVLQLDLRGNQYFPAISANQQNRHLARYLLFKHPACVRIDGGDLREPLTNMLRDLDAAHTIGQSYADVLRKWLVDDRTIDASARRIIKTLMEAPTT